MTQKHHFAHFLFGKKKEFESDTEMTITFTPVLWLKLGIKVTM